MKSKKTGNIIFHNILLYAVFGVYIFILLAFLFFKASSLQAVNLVPFHSITDYLFNDGTLSLGNVLGNVVLFLPPGIYLTLFNRTKKITINTLWIVLISVAVEILQYVMRVGVTDIDDVLLNGLGGFLGIIIFKIIYKIFKNKTRYVIEIASLIVGFTFLTLMACLSLGVFGFKIRIF